MSGLALPVSMCCTHQTAIIQYQTVAWWMHSQRGLSIERLGRLVCASGGGWHAQLCSRGRDYLVR
jgi:hypothetical protein